MSRGYTACCGLSLSCYVRKVNATGYLFTATTGSSGLVRFQRRDDRIDERSILWCVEVRRQSSSALSF